ncbi:MAG: hypothetical protein NTW79_04135 [Candidatus Berkelbacteria bacterium]|nr:hypothetical protein [Candidatus Berkelbacteria bacterium]
MKGKGISMVMFVVSVIAVLFAVLDASSVGIWLSASSWLIIAAVTGVWAIYLDAK